MEKREANPKAICRNVTFYSQVPATVPSTLILHISSSLDSRKMNLLIRSDFFAAQQNSTYRAEPLLKADRLTAITLRSNWRLFWCSALRPSLIICFTSAADPTGVLYVSVHLNPTGQAERTVLFLWQYLVICILQSLLYAQHAEETPDSKTKKNFF